MSNYAELVNPYIGTVSHLLKSTRPEAFLPHCYPKSAPLFDSNTDYFCNECLCGFPLGLVSFLPGRSSACVPEDFRNTVDHSRVEAHPYGYRMELEQDGVVVEAAVTRHGFCYRIVNAGRLAFRFPAGSFSAAEENLRINAHGDRNNRQFENEYLLLRLDCPFRVIQAGEGFLVIEREKRDRVTLKAALSFISFQKADEIYRIELQKYGFGALLEQARAVWNEQLSKIRVSGGSTAKQRVFYTALYRAFQRMVDYGEYGQYYSAYDGRVHDGEFFYTNDHIWDTFRCMHPLQLLLEPERQSRILESYNLMYRQSGLMPSCPNVGGDLPVMIGFHAAALFADALAKGLKVDYLSAYEGIRKNAMEQSMLPWVCGRGLSELERCYQEQAFYPALRPGEEEWVAGVHRREKRQAVSVTIEHSYDDWCAAQLAAHLGKEADAALFRKRAENWRNVYDAERGYMAPRDAAGRWILPFDPMWSGGSGGRDYFTENNTYLYTWSVLHDIPGLKTLMGGSRAMAQKLDQLFTMGVQISGQKVHKYRYLNQYPDATGLMGQFAMGNEPSFHIPYLYDYCGQPWKAQKRLRDLMDLWFTDSPLGICGDEDGGAMSSFFVFSAMGFYPVCPGRPEYALGTPLFDRIEICLPGGNSFRITAEGAGDGARYIEEACLNGKRLPVPFLTHSQIVRGGDLILRMGRRPKESWNA